MSNKPPTADEYFQRGRELLAQAEAFSPGSPQMTSLAALATAHFAAAEATVAALVGASNRLRILNGRWGG